MFPTAEEWACAVKQKGVCIMLINVTGRQFEITDAIQSRTAEALAILQFAVKTEGFWYLPEVFENTELDELRRIAYSGKDYLLQLQQRESEATGGSCDMAF